MANEFVCVHKQEICTVWKEATHPEFQMIFLSLKSIFPDRCDYRIGIQTFYEFDEIHKLAWRWSSNTLLCRA
jgi:hypothetical protein